MSIAAVNNGLLIAFPLAVCATLFFSELYQFARNRKNGTQANAKTPPSRLYSAIWWTQAVISVATFVSIVLDAITLVKSIKNGADNTRQPRLVSNIALFLFFAAGLLPDPDLDYQPGVPHINTWVVAIAFQIVVLVLPLSKGHLPDTRVTESFVFASEVIRLALLLINLLLLSYVEFARFRGRDGDGVYQPLATEEAVTGYGTSQPNGKPPGKPFARADAQSGGWLNYIVGFSLLFPYLWPAKSTYQQIITIICFLLLAVQRAINILVPYQLGALVGALGYGTVPYRELALYCLYRSLQGNQGIIGSIRSIIWIPVSQGLFRRLTYAAYEHVMILSLDFHLSKKTGEVIAALSKGGSLNTFFDGFAFSLFPMIFDLGLAAVYFFIKFNAFYSIITVGILWSYVFATIYMAKYRGRARRTMTNRDREMAAAKMDTIMAYETVHHNSALPLELERFAGYIKSFQSAEFLVLFSLNGLNAMQNLIFITGIVLIALLSAVEVSVGASTVASFVTVITYFAQLQAPLSFFGTYYTMVQNNLVDAERMLDLFNQVPAVQDSPDARDLTSCEGRLEFKNVSFSYDGRRQALDNVSFSVEPGTTTAIVGESGSGKSTCLKLIFRFYDVGSGSVQLDSNDLRELKLDSFRRNLGVVPQDTVLFNDTLWYNLRYGKPEATEEEIFAACRAASIHSKILAFPDGYDTIVGERGLKLSGGEKQRIAIARAILKAPRILMLDEATSSLDSETERLIQGALDRVAEGRTTIAIAHRLSTIVHADQIIVMHDGRIVERGRHAQLLAEKGRYAAMWQKQTQDGDDEKAVEETKPAIEVI